MDLPAWLLVWIWGTYLLCVIGMAAKNKQLPYQNGQTWLACGDLLAIGFLEASQTMPHAIPLGLRYLQIVSLAGGHLQAKKQWRWCYWLSLALACGASGYWQYSQQPGLLITSATGQWLGCFAMYKMITWYMAKPDSQPPEFLLNWMPRLRQLAIEKQEMTWQQAWQSQIMGHLIYCQKMVQTVCRSNAEEWQCQLQAHSDDQQELLLQFFHLLASPPEGPNRPTESQQPQQLDWESLIKRFFERVQLFQLALEWPKNKEGKPIVANLAIPLHIYTMENMPSRITILPTIFFQWLVFAWLHYCYNLGQSSPGTIIASSHDRHYIFKYQGRLWCQESSDILAEGCRCPGCGRHVRNLYRSHSLSALGCRECLRIRLEKQLQEDWEFACPSSLTLNSLWLARSVMRKFPIGNIHYGIQNWENWEYFVTIDVCSL